MDSQAALERATLTDHEVKGLSVNWLDFPPGSPAPQVSVEARARPASCEPVAEAVDTEALGVEPTAHNVRSVDHGRGGRGVTVMLEAYGPGQAETAVERLRSALRTCRSFTTEPGPHENGYVSVTRLPDPRIGDASVSFSLQQSELGGDPLRMPVAVVVARSGNTVGVFKALGLSDEKAVVPLDVVRAQEEKLRRSAGR